MTKRNLVMSMCACLMVAFLGACNPYPDGPLVSLSSKAKRVANTWKVEKATDDDGDDVTADLADDRYTLSEDGTALYRTKILGVSVELDGTWELTNDDASFRINVSDGSGLITLDQSFNIRRLAEDQFWLTSADDDDATLDLIPF
ncbi:MAG: hypothetical protein AAFR61_11195 [Bacteroidota bacterium]